MKKADKSRFLIRHGILAYIKTGEFHPTQRKRRMLAKDLEAMKKVAVSQTSNMSIKKEMLINDAIFCQGIMDLAMLYINKVGLFEEEALKKGSLVMQPIISELGRFMNTKRQNLMAVGLDLNADEALDVQAYIKEFDEDKKKKETDGKK